MNGIKEVLEHNDKWRALAFEISGDYDLAQDLVQDLYLKILDREEMNEAFIAISLKNLYIDSIRKKHHGRINDYIINTARDIVSDFEVEDCQLEYVERFNNLPMRQQELILESFDFSIRQIAERFDINRMYVHRQIHKGLSYVLGDDYKEYSNSNVKHLLTSDNKKD